MGKEALLARDANRSLASKRLTRSIGKATGRRSPAAIVLSPSTRTDSGWPAMRHQTIVSGAHRLDQLHLRLVPVCLLAADGDVLGADAELDLLPGMRSVDPRIVGKRKPDALRLEDRAAGIGDPADAKIHGRRADEAGDEAVGRPVVDVVRRVELLDDAGMHDGDAVGERQRLDLVVGDVDHRRLAEPLMQALQLDAKLGAELGVEVRQRLVEEEDVDVAHQRAADRDALALAAGKLRRPALQQRLDLQELGRRTSPASRSRRAARARSSARR